VLCLGVVVTKTNWIIIIKSFPCTQLFLVADGSWVCTFQSFAAVPDFLEMGLLSFRLGQNVILKPGIQLAFFRTQRSAELDGCFADCILPVCCWHVTEISGAAYSGLGCSLVLESWYQGFQGRGDRQAVCHTCPCVWGMTCSRLKNRELLCSWVILQLCLAAPAVQNGPRWVGMVRAGNFLSQFCCCRFYCETAVGCQRRRGPGGEAIKQAVSEHPNRHVSELSAVITQLILV